jgi:hypothetical protein
VHRTAGLTETPSTHVSQNIMRSRLLSTVFVVCLVAAVPLIAAAQKPKPQPSPPPSNDEQSETVFIRRVRLPITVVDKKGQFVPGLTKNDFLVLEDKVPQQVETFSDDLGQAFPLYVAVLMDTSPSTAGKLKFEQESAMNFIQSVIRPRRDRVLFATFDNEITLRSPGQGGFWREADGHSDCSVRCRLAVL